MENSECAPTSAHHKVVQMGGIADLSTASRQRSSALRAAQQIIEERTAHDHHGNQRRGIAPQQGERRQPQRRQRKEEKVNKKGPQRAGHHPQKVTSLQRDLVREQRVMGETNGEQTRGERKVGPGRITHGEPRGLVREDKMVKVPVRHQQTPPQQQQPREPQPQSLSRPSKP